MANIQISALSGLSAIPADNDLLVIVDVSDTTEAATGTTKHIRTDFALSAKANVSGQTFTGDIQAPAYEYSSSAILSVVDTTYTLVSTDNGKVIFFDNSSAITLNLPTGLDVGFSCGIIQMNAGQVQLSASLGTTLNSAGSATNLTGQYSMGTIIQYDTNVFVLGGDITA